ncbi:hypothetical protein [Vibrio sp. McD22-P3]|uniref:hypothetical protein n=1 Tax=Vibrio sp. McD22-P3 TaxID=2724880 RepID=UPI001F37740C|nr:hypothetical protein [Vibrio sp. McD22-P3]MCF4174307.1 hypothetical protein [Vibrio sp. McD22-P3]
MRKFMCRVGIVASLILSLVACGGEGDGDGSSGSGGDSLGSTSISPSSYISVSEQSAALTPNESISQHLMNLSEIMGSGNNAADSDRYYTSDNGRIIVIGPAHLPEDDFKWAATLGNIALTRALSAMNLDHNEYLKLKSGLSVDAASEIDFMIRDMGDFTSSNYTTDYAPILNRILDGSNVTYAYGSVAVPTWSGLQAHYSAFEQAEYQRELAVALAILPSAKEVELYDDLVAAYSGNGENRNVPAPYGIEPLVVRLDDTRSNSEWGAGTRYGFEVAPKSVIQCSDDVQIATHEVIHHLQITITNPTDGGTGLERWFSEGQAVKLSGMEVGRSQHQYPTLDVETFSDVPSVYPGFPEYEYEHYGQAYNWFVSKFGASAQYDILYDIRDDVDSVIEDDFSKREAFINSFNVYALPRDIDYYRADYPNQPK